MPNELASSNSASRRNGSCYRNHGASFAIWRAYYDERGPVFEKGPIKVKCWRARDGERSDDLRSVFHISSYTRLTGWRRILGKNERGARVLRPDCFGDTVCARCIGLWLARLARLARSRAFRGRYARYRGISESVTAAQHSSLARHSHRPRLVIPCRHNDMSAHEASHHLARLALLCPASLQTGSLPPACTRVGARSTGERPWAETTAHLRARGALDREAGSACRI